MEPSTESTQNRNLGDSQSSNTSSLTNKKFFGRSATQTPASSTEGSTDDKIGVRRSSLSEQVNQAENSENIHKKRFVWIRRASNSVFNFFARITRACISGLSSPFKFKENQDESGRFDPGSLQKSLDSQDSKNPFLQTIRKGDPLPQEFFRSLSDDTGRSLSENSEGSLKGKLEVTTEELRNDSVNPQKRSESSPIFLQKIRKGDPLPQEIFQQIRAEVNLDQSSDHTEEDTQALTDEDNKSDHAKKTENEDSANLNFDEYEKKSYYLEKEVSREQVKHQVPSTNDKVNQKQAKQTVPPIIHYAEEDQITRPHKDKYQQTLGAGHFGKVHVVKGNQNLVFKKTKYNIQAEYKIGAQINHPNVVKVHKLYRRQDGKYKLVMDRIEGVALAKTEELSDKKIGMVLREAKDCCGYLFDEGIQWGDLSENNIFIRKQSPHFQLCDFGLWKFEDDSKKKAEYLLIGAMELAQHTIKKSQLNLDEKTLRSIIFPSAIFKVPVDEEKILCVDYSEKAWMQSIQEKLAGMSETEQKNFLNAYFNEVIKAFDLAKKSA